MRDLALEPEVQAPHVTVEPPKPREYVAQAIQDADGKTVKVQFGDGLKATFSASWLRKIAEGA